MTRRSGPLHRITALNFAVAEEVLKTAALLVVPEDQKQRQAFEKLMPHLYVLRNKGCSWVQLTKMLGECGFNLQPSTVRSYFTELLAGRMDVCQARMNEQIALMAAIRSETAGVDVSAISGRVNAYLERLQQSAAPKVDAMFGQPTNGPVIEAERNMRPEPAQAAKLAQRGRPALPSTIPQISPQSVESNDEPPSDTPSGEFGLLGLSGPPQRTANRPAGFFTLDAEPPPPPTAVAPPARQEQRRQPKAPPREHPAGGTTSPVPPPAPTGAGRASAPSQGAIKKRISPMQSGVPPLGRRDNVPTHVYEPGELEHPAIPGLMLSLEHRVYGASLEYCDEEGDEAGVLKVETPDEKRFRVVWRQMVPITPTRTGASFTKMDPALFPPRS